MGRSVENNLATIYQLDQNEYLGLKLLNCILFPNPHAYVAMYFDQ